MSGVMAKLMEIINDYNWNDLEEFCLSNVRTILVFGVSVTACWLMFKKPRKIPPGPKFTLPVIGDLLQLSGEPDPRVPLRNMRKKYGDMFSFYMGQKLVVCLNGYDLIRDALVKNADDFSERPSMYVFDSVFQKKGIAFSDSETWKDQRKFALETLREFGFGKTIMEDKILEEVEEFSAVLMAQHGKPYDLCRITQKAVSNVIASLIFGQRFDYDSEIFNEFLERIAEIFEAVGNDSVMNFIPSLRFVPGDLFKLKRAVHNYSFLIDSAIHPSVKEHEEHYDEHDPRDFISSYLKEMKKVEKTGQKSRVDRKNLNHTVMDLFLAGTETTSTTVLWCMLYFIHYPNIQERCYKEIQDTVGSGRLPSLKDKDSMPYVQAVILEVLRLANIGILSLPHTVTKDVTFRGHLIPKGTIVLENLDSVLQDKDVWGDPEVFRPDRFLDADNKVIKRNEFIPFSMGRRVCIGESLARIELFLFVTTLVQRYEFKPVDPKNLPTLTGVFGLTHAPARYQLRAVPRA